MADNTPPNPHDTGKPPEDSSKKELQSSEVLDYIKSNARETVAYALLVLGILMIYFEPFYGGLLVGAIAGIYFGDEILSFLQNWKNFIEGQGIPRSLVVGGVLFALFISAPAIFIGAGLALLIKQVLMSGNPPTKSSDQEPPPPTS